VLSRDTLSPLSWSLFRRFGSDRRLCYWSHNFSKIFRFVQHFTGENFVQKI